MKVRKLLKFNDNRTVSQRFIETEDITFGRSELNGWIAEDGFSFFTETNTPPLFHPKTGEKLKVVDFFAHDIFRPKENGMVVINGFFIVLGGMNSKRSW